MFNIPASRIGRISNNLIAAALPFQLVFSLLAGYLFDQYGRVRLLLLSGLAICACIAVVPWTAPSIFLLGLVRIFLGIATQPMVVQPLVNDYVKKGSRGKAVSFNSLAIVVAEVLALGVLFHHTKEMDFRIAFFITALIILGLVLTACSLLKEPKS